MCIKFFGKKELIIQYLFLELLQAHAAFTKEYKYYSLGNENFTELSFKRPE